MSFDGKNWQELANGQNIDYSEEEKMALGLLLPLYWGYYIP